MTTKSSYKNLLSSLYIKTVNRKLDWELDDQKNTPTIAIAGRTIVIYESRNENDEPLEILIIKGEGDRVIESFNDEVFARQDVPDVPGFANFYLFMKDIREMAFKQAIGADDAIEQIILKLNEDE